MSDLDLEAFATSVLNAVQHGNWALVAALAVLALVWAARRFGGNKFPFLRSDAGGAVLALAMATAGAVVTALSAGSALSIALFLGALKVGFVAAGGWSTVKKLLPWIMNAKATAAGDAAVAANPAPGMRVIPISTLGRPSPETVAAFEATMIQNGYVKAEDGTWSKP